MIGRNSRSYQSEDFVFDPLHYLALLERKTKARDQAGPLVGWELPEAFNGRLRAGFLNTHWFLSLADAAEKLEA